MAILRILHVSAILSLAVGCSSSSFVSQDYQLTDTATADTRSWPTRPDTFVLPDANLPDPFDPNNDKKDTDCDGLSDAEEYTTVYPGEVKTDPANPDSDGDGIKDGVELGKTSSVDPRCVDFQGDADPGSQTIPVAKDTDLDGREDGHEDTNKNGKVDDGEIDPLNADSDGDGIIDGVEGELVNGAVNADETDPRKADTDGDGISDGVEEKVTKTNPTKADTDGDTCKDGQEDKDQDGVLDVGETNPNDGKDCGPANFKDADKDGISDAVEDANGNGNYDPDTGETDWQNPDTDSDGLQDGVEDSNKDGKVGLGETDPRRMDTDCDGLIDGPDRGTYRGEDQNANGKVDASESDPINSDTDGDGLSDGKERGVTTNPDPTHCKHFEADQDPRNTTDPTKKDTDGDGIADGSEDTNQNGKVDEGELDPNNKADGVGPAAQVCKASTLTPVVFRQEGQADITVALPPSFKELVPLKKDGKTAGLLGYDATDKVAFILYRRAGISSAQAGESNLRSALAAIGGLSNPITQSFTSWDKYPAVTANYSQAGGADIKTRTNAIAARLLGAGAGSLPGSGAIGGPFKIQAEIVHRSNNSSVVLVAITPQSRYKEPGIFKVGDLASGSALAQFGDRNAVQCEVFEAGGGKVDFLFVVDNSGSMLDHLEALADTANAMAAELDNSALDWRVGLVATDYAHPQGDQKNVFRGFTRDLDQYQAWLITFPECLDLFFTHVCVAWEDFPDNLNKSIICSEDKNCGVFNTQGAPQEWALLSAAKAVDHITKPTTEPMERVRPGAALVIIVLSDADDQSTSQGSIWQFTRFFNTPGSTVDTFTNRMPAGEKITVHGILCNSADDCGETQYSPRRTEAVVRATGGLQGDIETSSSIAATMARIVRNSIAQKGYKVLKPPIGTSIKVALAQVRQSGSCNRTNIPRSRAHGFDFDGVNRSISFFGACRPPEGKLVDGAVSYRYWIDTTPHPDANNIPCAKDPYFDANDADYCRGNRVCNTKSDVCTCPSDCGGTAPPGKTCNDALQVCDFVCTPDCGGSCGTFERCNVDTCGCECKDTAVCPGGFVFDKPSCSCTCDVQGLSCSPTQQVNEKTCSCQCKPDCGGCPAGVRCDPIRCECKNIG